MSSSSPMGTTFCMLRNLIPASMMKPFSSGVESNAILQTADKDFGELVFRQHLIHSGVLLMRLGGLIPDVQAELIVRALEQHSDELNIGFAFFPVARFGC